MTTKTLDQTAAVSEGQNMPVCEPQIGACIEFVNFCKEQHLNSRAAHTFLRVLHNKSWEHECEKIRDSMRPEINLMFEPAEKALREGTDCREALLALIHALKQAEEM